MRLSQWNSQGNMIGGNKDSCGIGGSNYTWGNGGDIESAT